MSTWSRGVRRVRVGVLVTVALGLVACGSDDADSSDTSAGETSAPASISGTGDSTGEVPAESSPAAESIAMIVNSNLGDGGFFDELSAAFTASAKAEGLENTVVETGTDPSRWEPAVRDAAENYDFVVAGTFEMLEIVETVAKEYPDTGFILFDIASDPETCGCDNIYSMTYNYREAGFVAGALGAMLQHTSGVERINDDQVIGFVGGVEIPVIVDFREGFINGSAHIDPAVEVSSAYAGSFSDPARGKSVAEQMISDGADVVFTAAGATDLGVIEAAASTGAWAIGNSKTQAQDDVAIVNGNLGVLTSVTIDTSASMTDAVQRVAAGSVPLGTTQLFGGADVIETPGYLENVPEDIRAQLGELVLEIHSGTIDVG